tara:strand:- start:151 stop:405 length:255 start_codon:yes stop_codon:yes gene_type:complete
MIKATILKDGKPILDAIGNTKQEAESDLLYQLVSYNQAISLQIIDNPTDENFVDDYINLIRKTDKTFQEKHIKFVAKYKKELGQ